MLWGGVIGYMFNDVFVLGGNVINWEIKRFEVYFNVYYFFVWVEYFDGLF